jgi:hypothetical protein
VPYVACARCARTAFTAAYWSGVEYCPHCGTELPRPTSAMRTALAFRRPTGRPFAPRRPMPSGGER